MGPRFKTRLVANIDRVRELFQKILPGDEFDYKPGKDTYWITQQLTSDGWLDVAFAGVRDLGENVHLLTVSGVVKEARGYGLQRRLIHTRVQSAIKRGGECVITYTMDWNTHSMNNLIKSGFLIYDPQYAWVGRDGIIYWRKEL